MPPGAPDAKPTSGETSIRFIPGQRILVDVRINRNAEAKLLLDTGSDKTLISPRALQAAGVRIAGPTTTAEVAGATGSTQIQFLFVDSLEVGEARVGRMSVGSQNLPVEGADGVLGRDFLDQFNVNISHGQVVDMGVLPLLGWFSRISGHVFADKNGNGRQDPGEQGLFHGLVQNLNRMLRGLVLVEP